MRDSLLEAENRLQFAGHETFPLRLLWLKKAHDAVSEDGPLKRTFQEQSAIARFGVGKNMVLSMRHWAVASGMLESEKGGYRPSEIAKLLFDKDGLDPFLESSATLWLIHAALAGAPVPCTTFYFAFNLLNQAVFDREGLNEALLELARGRSLRATAETLKRDVEVFLRSYVSRGPDGGEDASEPLLAELGLVRESRLSGQFEFVRGPQPTLPDAIFAVHLARHWRRLGEPPTLTAEGLAYAPGGPGRVFKMDEDSVVTRLMRIAEVTQDAMVWTDTAGLRQVNFLRPLAEIETLRQAYPARRRA
jgi:hypothetical protein